MSCPMIATAPALLERAPLAGKLPAAYPEAVNRRYRSIQDPRLVRRILLEPEAFTPDNALQAAVDLQPAALRIMAAARFALPPVLASASGAEHLMVRRVVAGFFSPGKVDAQAGYIDERVRQICAGLAARYRRGQVIDLAAELASVIPAEVMARMTGVPVPDPAALKRFSQDSLELFWGWPDAARQLELARTATEFHGWLGDSVAEAVARDDGNLYARLHAAGVDRDRIRSLGYFLTIAGQETTTLLIQTALNLALREGRWQDCAGSREHAHALVRRVLSQASSVPTWRRVVAADTVLEGECFTAGEQLVLQLSGGELGAANNDALAFGLGIHRCLGAALARMETELVLHAAAGALPGIEPVGAEPSWLHLLSFQAPATVPTRLRARQVAA